MSGRFTQAAALGIIALTSMLWGSAAEGTEGSEAAVATGQQALAGIAWAELRDATGASVGTVVFTAAGDSTAAVVTARLPAGTDGIHGFHVHANDDPDNGEGCIADPAQPANTHFVSADGHFNPGDGTHGAHAGDMPALFFTQDGRAAMTFVTDRFTPAEIKGRAVVLHAAPDNYGNVPVGEAANQYTPNSPAATTLTQNTGNAGNRIACGVIH
jgi:Cu-Zn family superoxide dismutase